MARDIYLFTGQWADMPLEELAPLVADWGYDGFELACWGDHFEVDKALADPSYVKGRRALLDRYGLSSHKISNHLVGQAVCDVPIDARHQGILPPQVWGDGDAEGVRQRAAERLKDTARAAAAFGATTVTGFSGSSIWHALAGFPPNPDGFIAAGYADFAERFNPILDVFGQEGVTFSLEVHPSEIAYDFHTTRATLDAVDHRPEFTLNLDPSHFLWQELDPVAFALEFGDKITNVHCKESVTHLDGRNGRLASHLPFGDLRRGWDFCSVGHGGVDWEHFFRAINAIGYTDSISVEWEDPGMDRLHGAPEALAFVRRLQWDLPEANFDAAFASDRS